jgi:hypothetical protein
VSGVALVRDVDRRRRPAGRREDAVPEQAVADEVAEHLGVVDRRLPEGVGVVARRTLRHPAIGGRVPQRDRAGVDVAEPLRDALGRRVVGDDQRDQLVGVLGRPRPAHRGARGLGRVAAAPRGARELPADLQAGPARRTPQPDAAEERAVGPALDDPLAVAAQRPMARVGGQDGERRVVVLGAAEEALDLGVAGHLGVGLDVPRLVAAQQQAVGEQSRRLHRRGPYATEPL